MPKKLLFPDDVKSWLRRRYENQQRSWLISGGSWPLSVSLGIPTEREVADNAAHVRSWVDAWTCWTGKGTLTWIEMQWPRIGKQRLPARLDLSSPADVASAVNEAQRFQLAKVRYEECTAQWPALQGSTVMARHFDMLADYPDAEYLRLRRLLSWLIDNPSSKQFVRQIPVPGIDTKWIDGPRRGIVSDLLQGIRGEQSVSDFYNVCGLRRPAHRLRIRLLCSSLRQMAGGLGDIDAPLDELTQFRLSPSCVLVVENLESGLALPDITGCVAFLKLGNAVSLLANLGWLSGVRVVYWGDIDTYGLAILDRARAALKNVTSVLMDEVTLLRHRDLWVREITPYPNADLPHLTTEERSVFDKLRANEWGQGVRLEQERIPWSEALAAVIPACE